MTAWQVFEPRFPQALSILDHRGSNCRQQLAQFKFILQLLKNLTFRWRKRQTRLPDSVLDRPTSVSSCRHSVMRQTNRKSLMTSLKWWRFECGVVIPRLQHMFVLEHIGPDITRMQCGNLVKKLKITAIVRIFNRNEIGILPVWAWLCFSLSTHPISGWNPRQLRFSNFLIFLKMMEEHSCFFYNCL